MKDYGEGKHFFECTDEQKQNRIDRYKRSQRRRTDFIFIFFAVYIIVNIILLLTSCSTPSKYKSPCNVQAVGYGTKR